MRVNYPKLACNSEFLDGLLGLISQKSFFLPKDIYSEITNTIVDLDAFAHTSAYIDLLLSELPSEEGEILRAKTSSASVLMAYDFHFNPESRELSLIEINTNASAFLIAELLYLAWGEHVKTPWPNAKSDLLHSFRRDGLGDRVLIIDEQPERQKMYHEFLMFNEWFEQQQIESTISDVESPQTRAYEGFVYNRYCDFVLASPNTRFLREDYLSGKKILSPSPKEFILLADKLRLFKFAEAEVSSSIIPMRDFQSFSSPDELWRQRKKYFFKPKRLFGGKAVFKGASISKKRFMELDFSQYLAQEIRPPGQIDGLKFDLRFYVYQNKIQLGVARFFKGQLLNFSGPDSGLAPIELV